MEPLVLRWDATFADAVAVRRRVLRAELVRNGLVGVLSMWALCLIFTRVGGWTTLAAIGSVLWPLTVVTLLALEPRRQVIRARQEGLLSLGPVRATLGPDGVGWSHEGARLALRWDALRDVSRDRRGLWLDLGLGQCLLVPARALAGIDLGALPSWRAAPAPPPTPPADDIGPWRLTSELELRDWLHAVEVALAVARRWTVSRAVRLFALLAALAWLLSLVTRPGGPALAGWVGIVVVWSGAQAFLGPRFRLWQFRRAVERDLRQLPLGPAEWRVGAAGVWVASRRGTARYAWSQVAAAERDDVQVRLTVGRAVLVVPMRAFASAAEADRFVAEARTWIDAAPRLRDGRPAPPRARPEPHADPFAPPPDRR